MFFGSSGLLVGELQNATVELDRCLDLVVAAIATSAPVDQNVTNKSFGRRPFLTVAWGKAPGGVRNTPRATLFNPNNSFWLAEGQPQPIVPFQKGHFFCGFCSLRPIPPSGDSQVGFQSTMDRWSVTRPGALPWAKLT